MGASFFETVVAGFYRVINRWRVWYRLPFPLAVINLLALRIDVHLVLKLRAISFHVGGATRASTQVELDIETAHTHGAMTFGAQMKFMLDLAPGFL